MMRSKWWISAVTALALLWTGAALADDDHGHGHGKGHGNGHAKHDRDDDRDRHYYGDHDRDEMRHYYREHGDHLPPGLAKRDRLPPGLERQLRVRGTLPPGLRAKMMPCPRELERALPPPPPGCAHFALGGHIVLVNRSNFMVLDIFHAEM
jgi:hypothetical protein